MYVRNNAQGLQEQGQLRYSQSDQTGSSAARAAEGVASAGHVEGTNTLWTAHVSEAPPQQWPGWARVLSQVLDLAAAELAHEPQGAATAAAALRLAGLGVATVGGVLGEKVGGNEGSVGRVAVLEHVLGRVLEVVVAARRELQSLGGVGLSGKPVRVRVGVGEKRDARQGSGGLGGRTHNTPIGREAGGKRRVDDGGEGWLRAVMGVVEAVVQLLRYVETTRAGTRVGTHVDALLCQVAGVVVATVAGILRQLGSGGKVRGSWTHVGEKWAADFSSFGVGSEAGGVQSLPWWLEVRDGVVGDNGDNGQQLPQLRNKLLAHVARVLLDETMPRGYGESGSQGVGSRESAAPQPWRLPVDTWVGLWCHVLGMRVPVEVLMEVSGQLTVSGQGEGHGLSVTQFVGVVRHVEGQLATWGAAVATWEARSGGSDEADPYTWLPSRCAAALQLLADLGRAVRADVGGKGAGDVTGSDGAAQRLSAGCQGAHERVDASAAGAQVSTAEAAAATGQQESDAAVAGDSTSAAAPAGVAAPRAEVDDDDASTGKVSVTQVSASDLGEAVEQLQGEPVVEKLRTIGEGWLATKATVGRAIGENEAQLDPMNGPPCDGAGELPPTQTETVEVSILQSVIGSAGYETKIGEGDEYMDGGSKEQPTKQDENVSQDGGALSISSNDVVGHVACLLSTCLSTCMGGPSALQLGTLTFCTRHIPKPPLDVSIITCLAAARQLQDPMAANEDIPGGRSPIPVAITHVPLLAVVAAIPVLLQPAQHVISTYVSTAPTHRIRARAEQAVVENTLALLLQCALLISNESVAPSLQPGATERDLDAIMLVAVPLLIGASMCRGLPAVAAAGVRIISSLAAPSHPLSGAFKTAVGKQPQERKLLLAQALKAQAATGGMLQRAVPGPIKPSIKLKQFG